MKSETINAYKAMEQALGEQGAKSVADFVLTQFDEMFDRYESKVETLKVEMQAEIKAVKDKIETLQTTIFTAIGVIPIAVGVIAFLATLLAKPILHL